MSNTLWDAEAEALLKEVESDGVSGVLLVDGWHESVTDFVVEESCFVNADGESVRGGVGAHWTDYHEKCDFTVPLSAVMGIKVERE
jgi:hypothetical protein